MFGSPQQVDCYGCYGISIWQTSVPVTTCLPAEFGCFWTWTFGGTETLRKEEEQEEEKEQVVVGGRLKVKPNYHPDCGAIVQIDLKKNNLSNPYLMRDVKLEHIIK